MSNWLLAAVGCVYLWVAWDYYAQHNIGMALSFFAYALANIGFILANVKSISSS